MIPLKTFTSEKRPWIVNTLRNMWNYIFKYEQTRQQEQGTGQLLQSYASSYKNKII